VTTTFALLPNLGFLEVAIILVILLVIFGPKRIPAAFRAIGDAFKGFRETVGGDEEDRKEPPALPGSSTDQVEPSGSADKAPAEKTGARKDA
jgi:sec-independent protein translocase protein TatA